MSNVVRGKSYVTIHSLTLRDTTVPVRVSVNKPNLIPKKIMSVLIGVFRNGRRVQFKMSDIPVIIVGQR